MLLICLLALWLHLVVQISDHIIVLVILYLQRKKMTLMS